MKDQNSWVVWGLAVSAIAAGYVAYGWPGVLLAITMLVFWLLLQFSRSMRLMKKAAENPIGSVTSAVMLQSKLRAGMGLADVMKLSGSFGLRAEASLQSTTAAASSEVPEVYHWTDPGGDRVEVVLLGGAVQRWQLQRGVATELPSEEEGSASGTSGKSLTSGTTGTTGTTGTSAT